MGSYRGDCFWLGSNGADGLCASLRRRSPPHTVRRQDAGHEPMCIEGIHGQFDAQGGECLSEAVRTVLACLAG